MPPTSATSPPPACAFARAYTLSPCYARAPLPWLPPRLAPAALHVVAHALPPPNARPSNHADTSGRHNRFCAPAPAVQLVAAALRRPCRLQHQQRRQLVLAAPEVRRAQAAGAGRHQPGQHDAWNRRLQRRRMCSVGMRCAGQRRVEYADAAALVLQHPRLPLRRRLVSILRHCNRQDRRRRAAVVAAS